MGIVTEYRTTRGLFGWDKLDYISVDQGGCAAPIPFKSHLRTNCFRPIAMSLETVCFVWIGVVEGTVLAAKQCGAWGDQ